MTNKVQRLSERLRSGVGTSMDIGPHLHKYQNLCNEAADELNRLSTTLDPRTIETCAKVADAHKGQAARDRHAKGGVMNEEVMSEERGETIAAEIIAAAIRALAH